MSLPALCRSTASQAIKRNIRFSEVLTCTEPPRLAWRVTRLLDRHARDRAAERRADPQRYDRCPSLAERAVRRSPAPACASSCLEDWDDVVQAEDGNNSHAVDTGVKTKGENVKCLR